MYSVTGTVGVAVRECRLGGRGWGVANLADCRSAWLTRVSSHYRQRMNGMCTLTELLLIGFSGLDRFMF